MLTLKDERFLCAVRFKWRSPTMTRNHLEHILKNSRTPPLPNCIFMTVRDHNKIGSAISFLQNIRREGLLPPMPSPDKTPLLASGTSLRPYVAFILTVTTVEILLAHFIVFVCGARQSYLEIKHECDCIIISKLIVQYL